MSWPDEPFLNLRQIATPNGVPAQGGQLLYVKSDGKLYTKDASGVETPVETALGDVTLAGVQTLTNKTISADNNTLSGIAASSFVLSNGSGNIDGAAAQKVIPAGVVVGTTDTQTLTNKTLSTGTLVGAATTDISGAWTTYTPSATNFTVGNGSLTGRYVEIGKTVVVRINFTAGSTTTYTASGATVTLPVSAHGTGNQVLSLVLNGNDAGNARILTASPTVCQLQVHSATGNVLLAVMSSATFNPGTTGSVEIEGVYEAA